MDFKTWAASERGKSILAGSVAILVALLIFHAGLAVGSHRGLPPPPHGPEEGLRGPGFLMVRLPHGFIADGHGAVGTITEVSTSSFTMQTREGESETVQFSDRTAIRNADGSASTTALAPGNQVIVLGVPGSDSISAEIIRIIPNGPPSAR